jgi:hypothetical protein
MHNAPVYVMLCNIMKEVVSAASDAELARLFHNGKEALYLAKKDARSMSFLVASCHFANANVLHLKAPQLS